MKTIPTATVRPSKTLNLLSPREMAGITNPKANVFKVFRECALAVLNTGSEDDDALKVYDTYSDFDIRIISESRGIKIQLSNAPASAFVGGKMIKGVQEHLFAVLRDIVFTHHKITEPGRFDFENSEGISDGVFRILRNASIVRPNSSINLVVCWGGHAISRAEYDFTKQVGYELGLRGLNIATGCGTGAMKGPMKGAVIGHGKQQINNGRYIGITEPGIIASESPNPTVNELVILPDIEKRLEAFVRLGHVIVVFPGGAGTAEEILFLLGLLMEKDNAKISLPVVFAASEDNASYFTAIDKFIRNTLGEDACKHYQIVTGSAAEVANTVIHGIEKTWRFRRKSQDSYAYNWLLSIPLKLQQPFNPSHENMAKLKLNTNIPKSELASELRRAFSGIVAGNIKANCVRKIQQKGPFQLKGEPTLMKEIDQLLQQFIDQGRMKLNRDYKPCYIIDATAVVE
jgi:predicted Rossmann-fold nucleotide-binding protein